MNPEVQAYISELREQILSLSDRAAGLAGENAKLKQRIFVLEERERQERDAQKEPNA